MLSTCTLVPLTHCWVCGHHHFTPVNQERFDIPQENSPIRAYDQQTFWLRRCSHCDFIQPEGVPEHPAFFDELYSLCYDPNWFETGYSLPHKDFVFQTILRGLSRRLPADRRTFLDVGTNLGRMLTIANQAGWQVEGIELNPEVAAFAAQRTGLPVYQLNANQLAQTGRRYDSIALTDVLEHLPDPVAILSDVRKLLRPGGWIAIKVPHGLNQLRKERIRQAIGSVAHAEIAKNLIHINHFSPASLNAALTAAGFDQISMTIGAPMLPLEWSREAILSRSLRSTVYRIARSIPGGIHTPLALNLQAYARSAS